MEILKLKPYNPQSSLQQQKEQKGSELCLKLASMIKTHSNGREAREFIDVRLPVRCIGKILKETKSHDVFFFQGYVDW